MAEFEFAGAKFRGGKMAAVLVALSTLGGGLWGGFEAYARYKAMEDKINSYVAPDLSEIEGRLDLLQQDMGGVKQRLQEVQDIARDTREDTRSDAALLHNAIGHVDKRSRQSDLESREAMRQAEITIRDIIANAQNRFDTKINSVDEKLDALEKRINKNVQQALDNPLLKK